MVSSTNRNTQVDILASIDHASSPKAPGKAVLTNSRYAKSDDNSRSDHKASDKDATRTGVQTMVAKTPTKTLKHSWESPWYKYDKVYDLELGGTVNVAVRKHHPIELVQVRTFDIDDTSEILKRFRMLQHQNIVTAIEAFTTDSSLFIVLEHMPISLDWIIRSPAYPDDQQLAAILGQIVTGIAYLAKEGYAHESLTCSDILLNNGGYVKIANQECCKTVAKRKGEGRNIRDLSFITMELMQKYVKEDGAIGIDDLYRWPSESEAVEFLSATTSSTSAEELLKQPLLSRAYSKESLFGIISLAQVSIRGHYRYKPQQ